MNVISINKNLVNWLSTILSTVFMSKLKWVTKCKPKFL